MDPDLVALCRAEHTRLVWALTLYTGDRFLAEDLAQEALVRLHQHWPRARSMSGGCCAAPGAGRRGDTTARFGLQVRDADGRWLDATEAPFDLRIDAAIVPAGDKLVIVGGTGNAGPGRPADDRWVFDLAG